MGGIKFWLKHTVVYAGFPKFNEFMLYRTQDKIINLYFNNIFKFNQIKTVCD